ncbi:chitin-binding lectin 1-like isoform X2 [Apis florea]|uniref:chitin-binding lectin 1-like isoform X2 n=1 Tax=Apis florea TaxID=7463 RepID=UPI0012FF346D|nr:chitin-binding lectin 1-like isoform X2 [Apis florea]
MSCYRSCCSPCCSPPSCPPPSCPPPPCPPPPCPPPCPPPTIVCRPPCPPRCPPQPTKTTCRIPVNTKEQGVQKVSFERIRGPDSCNLTRIIDGSVILNFCKKEKKKKGSKHITKFIRRKSLAIKDEGWKKS